MLNDNTFRGADVHKFGTFARAAAFACGHNIFSHDLEFLKQAGIDTSFFSKKLIDTLHLSALLFSNRPYHKLVKDYQLNKDHVNDPVADSRLSARLLSDIIEKWHTLPGRLRTMYSSALHRIPEFAGFLQLVNDDNGKLDAAALAAFINEHFKAEICINTPLVELIQAHPAELSYALSLVTTEDPLSITPPWLLHRYPAVNEVIYLLRATNCRQSSCSYCSSRLDPVKALKRFFNYDEFRKFEGDDEVPMQEQAVRAALDDQSLLVVFPTGGGKSLTFQLPALMRGDVKRALTVVISPLVSLMKDQVDVLGDRFERHEAVAINGLLSPLERAQAISRAV